VGATCSVSADRMQRSWPISLISTPQHVFIQSHSRALDLSSQQRDELTMMASQKDEESAKQDKRCGVARVKGTRSKFYALSLNNSDEWIGRFTKRSISHCVIDPVNFVANSNVNLGF